MKSKELIKDMPRFLIDTGSELNIIKQGLLKTNVFIDKNTMYGLPGINEGLVLTQECARIKLGNVYCRLNIVPDEFPIQADGILGVEFLREQEATLSFRDDTLHWGNPRETVPQTSNPNRATGYVARINAGLCWRILGF